jgi:hypothetical protein
MKIRVYADESISLDLPGIVAGLSSVSKSLTWSLGKTKFSIKGNHVEYPGSYADIPKKLIAETKGDQLVVFFTEKPYDNNYFFESGLSDQVIVSLYGWDHLTTIPRNNGAVYFLIALLVRLLGIGGRHTTKNTGCINDFWLDKTGVDAGMRSAFICTQCLPGVIKKGTTQVHPEEIGDFKKILDEVSAASRADEDVCSRWARRKSDERFDVFLCHNSTDKPAIRNINKALLRNGVRTWLDEQQLPPGRVWQSLLEEQIETISTVAIFVGPSGIGPWQNAEMRSFLSEFANRKCPVIPVILADCKTVPQLPLFLRQFTWVDFRKAKPSPMEQLLWGITGEKPAF